MLNAHPIHYKDSKEAKFTSKIHFCDVLSFFECKFEKYLATNNIFFWCLVPHIFGGFGAII